VTFFVLECSIERFIVEREIGIWEALMCDATNLGFDEFESSILFIGAPWPALYIGGQ
jgi:hypothetical protein